MSNCAFKELFQLNGNGYVSERIDTKDKKDEETYTKWGNQAKTPVVDVTTTLSKIVARIKESSKDYEDLTVIEQHEWIVQKIREECPDLPDFMVNIIPPSLRTTRFVEPTRDKPEWLDMEKFRRGQKFAQDNLVGSFFCQICSLFLLFSFDSGMKVLVYTRKSDTPYQAFKRYLSTGIRLRNWYTEDPWTKGTAAYDDIKTVQRMHTGINRKLRGLSKDEFAEATKIQDLCCPLWPAISNDLKSTPQPSMRSYCPFGIVESFYHEFEPISQHHMFATQFAFASLVVLYPREFGAHYATREDLDAFCHVWRVIGYLLGIEDEYNICRGSFDEVTQRFKSYLELCIKPNLRMVTPEWEHMMICVFEGLEYYVPGITTASAFLFITDLLNIRTPHLKASISYGARIRCYFIKFILRYASMFSTVKNYLRMRLNAALNRAASFPEEKHAELKMRSAATITQLSSCCTT